LTARVKYSILSYGFYFLGPICDIFHKKPPQNNFLDMPQTYYIESSRLDGLLEELRANHKVFLPVGKENSSGQADYSYQDAASNGHFLFNPYRVIEPLKTFFTPPLAKAAEYFSQDALDTGPLKTIVFGVKSCDLAGHKIQDFVFLEGVEVDSLYRLKKENIIIISGDCTDFKEVCHCLAWDILPHPTAGFDLNLSPLNDGYLVEVGSEKGEELIQQYKGYLR